MSGAKSGGDETAKPTLSPPMVSPHSHSIVLGDGSALIHLRKFFRRARKNRLANPSEIYTLDFKE
jgi:hypothetical protein